MRRILLLTLLAFVCLMLLGAQKQKEPRPLVVAQLSDTHLGLSRAPDAERNLQQAVEMIAARKPDLVIVSGDIGERSENWQRARQILSALDMPVLYLPGNHDTKSTNVERYRRQFGEDYYTMQFRHVTFVVLNSQLLGNYEKYEAKTTVPLPAEGQAEAEKMLAWLRKETQAMARARRNQRGGGAEEKQVVIAVQHVPLSRAGDFPPDPRPYWISQEPWRSRAIAQLRELGVEHVLAGHWHRGMVFRADGMTHHVAPATSWLPLKGKLGFAMHEITRDGDVRTRFVYLDGSEESAE
jgi:3',5'-cyclic AMP phosphodiesterase CpdA